MRFSVIYHGRISEAEIRKVKEHYEIYINGKFYASADWLSEAIKECEMLLNG